MFGLNFEESYWQVQPVSGVVQSLAPKKHTIDTGGRQYKNIWREALFQAPYLALDPPQMSLRRVSEMQRTGEVSKERSVKAEVKGKNSRYVKIF
jgi:hypothetical protein